MFLIIWDLKSFYSNSKFENGALAVIIMNDFTKLKYKSTILIPVFLMAGLLNPLQNNFAGTKEQKPEISLQSKNFLSNMNLALVEIANLVKPAVVNITAIKLITLKNHSQRFYYKSRKFRKNPQKPRHKGPDKNRMPQKFRSTSKGSGVIMSSDGYILTNSHVVRNAEKIIVLMHDGKKYIGKVVASDKKTDVAVIKIKAKNLPTIKMGNSDELRVGEVVIAIGNPYGLNQTVTMGIVSAMGRSNVGIADYEDFIQTDAAINPGNSGGPMVNINGELVGLNTAIFSTSGGYQGIGFAIPSNMAKSVMDSLIKIGRVIRGWIGVQIQELTPGLARHFGLKEESAVLVANIFDKSPAQKAGLLRGDLILKFKNKKIKHTRHLRNLAAGSKPGEKVEIEILHNKKLQTVTLVIGQFPDKEYPYNNKIYTSLQGVNIQNLDNHIKSKLNIPEKIDGVIITHVDPKSPAFPNLRRNDILLEINRNVIRSTEDFNKIVSGSKIKDDLLVLIYRMRTGKLFGSYMYLTIPFKK